MNKRELIQALEKYPDDFRVVVSGYEGGFGDVVGGSLDDHPKVMGWPIGWTELKPLGMDGFRQWLKQHGKY